MPIFYVDSGSIERMEVSSSLLVSGSSIIRSKGGDAFVVYGTDGNRVMIVSSSTESAYAKIGDIDNVLNGTNLEINAVTETISSNGAFVATSGITSNQELVVTIGGARITGSLKVRDGITGSLFGTASFSATASYALTAGGDSAITIADEGTSQGTATFLNFIGDSVTATVSANTASITISAGGAGFPYSGIAEITGSIILSSGSAIFPTLLAAESLTAGDFVNIYSGGVRKASNDDTTKQAHGFVLSAYTTSDPVYVYYSGLNTSNTGLTAGSRYFLGTSGGETTTPPTNTGQLSQEVGVAISTTAILVNFGPAIVT